eukprot:2779218-Rhodomonas_salina.2
MDRLVPGRDVVKTFLATAPNGTSSAGWDASLGTAWPKSVPTEKKIKAQYFVSEGGLKHFEDKHTPTYSNKHV